MEVATFGAGCFWCVEAAFQQLKGVESVVSGYSGGHVENPSYKQVTTGRTGHAEVCRIEYDPEQISYDELLEAFFEIHDPTTPNRQGNDVGPQYRSVIFFHDEEQRKAAERAKKSVDESGVWDNPVVTEIVPFTKFFQAEDYHQDYFRRNPNQRYCQLVIKPKLDKFERVFKLKLRD
ncbi:MAG: peptide-methionine (S)-S-oxide reductase MsrA [Candidatus Thorarchaeota archaeon]